MEFQEVTKKQLFSELEKSFVNNKGPMIMFAGFWLAETPSGDHQAQFFIAEPQLGQAELRKQAKKALKELIYQLDNQ